MNYSFVYFASAVCLFAGAALIFLPGRRYYYHSSVGLVGSLLLLSGVVLMTTFKWTEVFIKVSGLEFQLAKAEEEARMAKAKLASISNSVNEEDLLNQVAKMIIYEHAGEGDDNSSNSEDYFPILEAKELKGALDKSNVVIVPWSEIQNIEAVPDVTDSTNR